MNSRLGRIDCVLALFAFAIYASNLIAQELPAAQPLRVLTYNVRYASDDPPNRWNDRRPVAKAMLQDLQVDLIGMQEATHRQVKDFEADLPDFKWVGAGRDGGKEGEFMAVFYRSARLKLLEHSHYWLSDTPEVASSSWGNVCKRMVTWARFQDSATEQEFYLTNTHLDHQSQQSRDKSAQLIVNRCAKLDTDLPIVITGDFNSADTTSSVYRTFMESGFADTWNQAKEKGSEKNTFHGYRPPPEKGHNRIDWILSRGKVTTTSTRIVEFQTGGQFPSDHFPVVADLVVGSKPFGR